MKVSVCMAVYNGEKYIYEQISSIICQLGENDELIISDDGSMDCTVDLVNEFNDSRIKIIYNRGRHGYIGNFENALRNVTGEYIFLSDQDDVWMPNKYEIMMHELQTCDLVVSNSMVTDSNLNVIEESFFECMNSGPGILKNILRSTYYGSCMAFKKEILSFALPFPKTNEIGHDLWIGLIGEIVGKVRFVNTPLIKYRRHEFTATSLNVTFSKSNRSVIKKIKGRLIMIKEIIRFYIKYYF